MAQPGERRSRPGRGAQRIARGSPLTSPALGPPRLPFPATSGLSRAPRRTTAGGVWLFLLAALLPACAPGGSEAGPGQPTEAAGEDLAAAAALLQREANRLDSAAAAVDSVFQPLPVLRPAEEEALRRYPNAVQLERARALGVGRELSDARLEALQREGRLVALEDGDYWVVRDLDHSRPLVVPGVRELLTEIGRRFQARLEELGAPPFRFEVSSVLRSAADQEALRRVNPNAALGESTHEYGTTVDVGYNAFAAPVQPIGGISTGDAEWASDHLHRYAQLAAERVAARRSLELQAVLAKVLLEMQEEGRVMVTLERLQPVFHMTLAGPS